VKEIEQLQSFLRAVAAIEREVARVAPFCAYFDEHDELKYLNYAIPDDDAEPSMGEIEALRAAFAKRRRLPRLEWIAEAAPAVAGALERAGMREELSTPLMACSRADLRMPRAQIDAERVNAADELAVRNMQRVAFGQAPLGASAEAGGGGVAAEAGGHDVSAETPRRTLFARVDGEIATASGWSEVVEGVSEVVGVATAEAYRRRGFAGAMTAAATQAAFDEGAELCVLSPGDETAMRVYERAGFRRVATMLHWSDA
jgi:ribosomal protein S18 acetylase RimI-like enzyme